MKLVSVTQNRVTYYHLFTDDLSKIEGVQRINLDSGGTTIELIPANLELYHTTDLEAWLKTQKLEQV